MPVPCHFLLVDDNAADRMLAEEAFEQLCPDCSLTTVSGGREALQLLRREAFQPDVILLDVNMPGMSGFELLEQLKKDPALQKIPVVMLTTSCAERDITQAYSLHASSYLVKSSVFEAFLEQVRTFAQYWQASRVANG